MQRGTPPPPMTASDLRDITRGLHDAAAAASEVVAQQYIRLFDQFFDVDADRLGAPMKAKMIEVELDADHYMRVPLIALVSPRGLALESMSVDLSVQIKACEMHKLQQIPGSHGHSESFKVSIGANRRESHGRGAEEVQINLQFKACETPEGLNRLIEQYTHLISPIAARAGDADT